jgi:hypothetical protein
MNKIQRKYKVIKASSLSKLEKEVNDLIQKEYKDTEGFLYRSSGRWQCMGGIIKDNEEWLQSMVFVQEED